MTIRVSYSEAVANLDTLFDEVVDDREIVIIQRENKGNVALVAADELTSLLETIYLLRSPANAERLSSALDQSLKGEGKRMTLDELRREVGL